MLYEKTHHQTEQRSRENQRMLAEDRAYHRRLDIQKLDDLPPMPAIASELLAILNDDEAEIEDIAAIISKDPALTAKLLSLANSAFFGFGRSVNSVTDAIINVLGLELVKGLSIGIIMSNSFNSERCPGFDVGRYWSNSIMTATMIRNIAQSQTIDPEIQSGFYYLYGLLHNIGLLVLADCYPEEMSDVFLAAERETETRLSAIENDRLGINHYEAGQYLADKWNLPTDVIVAIRHHSNFEYRERHFKVSQITGYCSRLVQNCLHQSNLEARNNLIPTLLDIDADKCSEIASKVSENIDEIQAVADKMTGSN